MSARTTTRLLLELFAELDRREASAAHISPWPEGDLAVELVVDYERITSALDAIPKVSARPIVARLMGLAMLDKGDRRTPQVGSFTLELEGRVSSWLVSVEPSGGLRESVTLRRIAPDPVVPLEATALRGAASSTVLAALDRGKGLVLAVGARGVGRQAFLDSCLLHLASPENAIVSIVEQPRQPIEGVQTSLAEPRAGATIKELLEAALDTDAEIVRVYELRDASVVRRAVSAAGAGQLVLSTMAMADAPSVVPRLLDARVDPSSLAEAMALIVGMARVRRLCEECRGEGHEGFYSVGCDRCGHTGYLGTATAYQVIDMGESERSAIREGDAEQIRLALEAKGGTLRGAALELAERGVTTIDEAVSATPSL